MIIEKILARRYYGNHARGVVVLVNGQPRHFTGKDANREADRFIEGVSIGADQKYLVAKMVEGEMMVYGNDGEWEHHSRAIRLHGLLDAVQRLSEINHDPSEKVDWGPRVLEYDGSCFGVPDEAPATRDEILKFVRDVEKDSGVKDVSVIRNGVVSVLENFFSIECRDEETLDELVAALLAQDNVFPDYWPTVSEVSERAF